jgi:hypothetical protein
VVWAANGWIGEKGGQKAESSRSRGPQATQGRLRSVYIAAMDVYFKAIDVKAGFKARTGPVSGGFAALTGGFGGRLWWAALFPATGGFPKGPVHLL